MTLTATLKRGVIATLMSCAMTGCATISVEEMTAVHAAEAFVVRHGFTDLPHPQDQPVEMVKLLDPVAPSAQELLRERHGSIQPKAIGFVREAHRGSYSVLFRATKDPREILGVWVEGGQATQFIHSSFPLNEIDWVAVPANNSLQRR
jgi:hypothetical protein